MSVEVELEAVAEALSAGEQARALDHALAAWRLEKHAELADLVFAIAAAVDASQAPLDAGKETSQTRRWHARAEERRAASLGLLLADIVDQGPHVARSRLEALAGWPPDPRLTRALVGWLERPPFRGAGRARFFPTVIGLLEAQKDPAALPTIDRLLADRTAAVRRIGIRQLASLDGVRETLVAATGTGRLLPSARASMSRIDDALKRERRAPQRRLAADLLADVYASPEDDAPRLVYADAVAETGDPRGEFIVLQCERARSGKAASRRERELLRSYERAWLGPLERVVLKAGVVYERGFLAGCRYQAAGEANVDDAAEWSTVVELDVLPQSSFVSGSSNLLLKPHLRALRRVHGMQIEDLEAIVTSGTRLPWEAISIKLWRSALAKLLGVLGKAKNLASVRSFGLVNESVDERAIAAVVASPLGQRLTHLSSFVPPDRADAIRRAALAGPSLERLDLRYEVATVSLHRDGRAIVTLDGAAERSVLAAATALGTLAKGSVASLAVAATVGTIEGTTLVRGRYAKASIVPLVEQAKRLGVELARRGSGTDVVAPK